MSMSILRKVKASVLNRILERVSSEEELKYATLGLQIFKTQGIDLRKKTGTLFVKVSARARCLIQSTATIQQSSS